MLCIAKGAYIIAHVDSAAVKTFAAATGQLTVLEPNVFFCHVKEEMPHDEEVWKVQLNDWYDDDVVLGTVVVRECHMIVADGVSASWGTSTKSGPGLRQQLSTYGISKLRGTCEAGKRNAKVTDLTTLLSTENLYKVDKRSKVKYPNIDIGIDIDCTFVFF